MNLDSVKLLTISEAIGVLTAAVIAADDNKQTAWGRVREAAVKIAAYRDDKAILEICEGVRANLKEAKRQTAYAYARDAGYIARAMRAYELAPEESQVRDVGNARFSAKIESPNIAQVREGGCTYATKAARAILVAAGLVTPKEKADKPFELPAAVLEALTQVWNASTPVSLGAMEAWAELCKVANLSTIGAQLDEFIAAALGEEEAEETDPEFDLIDADTVSYELEQTDLTELAELVPQANAA